MKIVFQPEGSNLCGQACVAMLLNISLDHATMLVGKKGRTKIIDLAKALSFKLVLCLDIKLVRIKNMDQLPELGIVRVRWDKKQSHWVVKKGDWIYDPVTGECQMKHYLQWLESINAKITSHFPLKYRTL